MDTTEFYLNRLSQPERETVRYLHIPSNDAGVHINHDNALKFSAVWACVRVIAETVSQLRWTVFQQQPDGGKRELETHPAYRVVAVSPNPEMTPFQWRETLLGHVLTYGNAFCEIERDNANRPVACWPLAPDRVDVLRDENWELLYRYHMPSGGYVDFGPQDILHLAGLGFDGNVGYSVVAMAAQTIGLGRVQEQAGASFWKNGARPGGILTPVGTMTREGRDSITDEWNSMFGGGRNFNRVAMLSHDMKYTPLSIPQEDAQFIDSRKFSIEEICRWYRVPPHKVASLDRATFSNIEHQSIEFVVDTIVPWAIRFEQEIDSKLIRSSSRKVYSKVLVQSLLRGDSAARATYYRELRDLGALSINEIRMLEDMNPIDGGDLRLVPMNMTTIERAAEPPEPPEPATPAVMPESDADEDLSAEDSMAAFWKQYSPLVESTMHRIATREAKELQRMKSPTEGKVRQFYDRHAEYMQSQLQPLFAVFNGACESHVTEHCTVSLAEAQAGIANGTIETTCETWTTTRVADEAEWILNGLWEAKRGQ